MERVGQHKVFPKKPNTIGEFRRVSQSLLGPKLALIGLVILDLHSYGGFMCTPSRSL